jgi:hypothetical protein
MTALPGLGHPRGTERPLPGEPDDDLRLFARIEGLAGEEAALLQIPAEQRSRAQHDRLRRLSEELDRAFEALRERAHRLAGRDAAGEQN